MNYIKKLVGDRIYLSPKVVSEEEVEKFTNWMNDFQVTDYTGRSSAVVSYETEKEWLEKASKNNDDIILNIITLDENKLIGTIGIHHINNIARSAVLGIFIGDGDYRSHGYGTEAIKLILDFVFNYLNLNSMSLTLLDVNERAHKCYLKSGFKDTGRLRKNCFINGHYHDTLYMDILKEEFEGEYIRNKNV